MQKSATEIIARWKRAQTRKDEWRGLYEECYEYALPQRNLYDQWEGRTTGKKRTGKLFDSTAVNATQRFANRIQSGLFPPYKQWARLEPGEAIPPEQRAEVQVALDQYQTRFFDLLKQSNFDLAMGEFLLDLCVGTACMLVQPGDDLNPIRYTAVPQYLCSFEEGPAGTVETVFRRMRRPVSVIEREWPDLTMTTELKRLKREAPHTEIELVEATCYHDDDGLYGYYLVTDKTKDSQPKTIVYRTMTTSPWIIARYMKASGEVMGRGPLLNALPDIKTVNKVVEFLLKNASLAIGGIYTAADDGVLNPQVVQIKPGAIIPVARNGGPMGASLMPLKTASDVNLTQLVIQDLRMSIKQALLDNSLPPENMSARSATEIVERMRELATNLGSAFGRLITECMVPMVRRSLAVMDQLGLVVLPLRVNGLEVKVIPVSPLAKAQAMDDVQDMMQWLQFAQSLGPMGLAAVRMDAVLDYMAGKLGIPQTLITSQEERQQMAAMAQQAAAENPELAAQALAGGGGMPSANGRNPGGPTNIPPELMEAMR